MLSVSREELYRILCRLVGAEQSIVFVIAAAIDRCIQDLIHSIYIRAFFLQYPLGACTGMDVAVYDVICVIEDLFRMVGEDDLSFSSGSLYKVAVISHIIHSRELMFILAKEFPVLLLSKDIAVWVHSRFIYLIHSEKGIAYLIRRIAEHEHYLFSAHGDSSQADSESVS